MKILIVEDDSSIAELLSLILEKEGYETRRVYDGSIAVVEFHSYSPQLILLDLMLPGKDGYQICNEIRRVSHVPIIMLTAKGETFDKVLGLELGADDYIVKPFDTKELTARVKAVLRRYEPKDSQSSKITLSNLVIDQSTYTVVYHGSQLELPPKEFELIFFLASNPNKVFSREQLIERIWGYDFMGDTRTVDVHVKRLREKMPYEDDWNLKTVWGVGYKMEVK
jgi:DNA-binding response OmpR family regulator